MDDSFNTCPYIDLNNGTLLDQEMEVIWKQEPPDFEMDTDEIYKYLTDINKEDDYWRLPTIQEMIRLLNWINLNLELSPLLFRFPLTCQCYMTSNKCNEFIHGAFVVKANTLDIIGVDLIFGPRTKNLICCIHNLSGDLKNVSSSI